MNRSDPRSRFDAALLARSLAPILSQLHALAPELVRIGARMVGVERARQILNELEREAPP